MSSVLFQKLDDFYAKILHQSCRSYGNDWSDWENKRTGNQPYPCVYIL